MKRKQEQKQKQPNGDSTNVDQTASHDYGDPIHPDEARAANITARALGQLSERVADGEMQQEDGALAEFAEQVGEALRSGNPEPRSLEIRHAIEQRLAELGAHSQIQHSQIQHSHDQQSQVQQQHSAVGRRLVWRLFGALAAGLLLVGAGLEMAGNFRSFTRQGPRHGEPLAQLEVPGTSDQPITRVDRSAAHDSTDVSETQSIETQSTDELNTEEVVPRVEETTQLAASDVYFESNGQAPVDVADAISSAPTSTTDADMVHEFQHAAGNTDHEPSFTVGLDPTQSTPIADVELNFEHGASQRFKESVVVPPQEPGVNAQAPPRYSDRLRRPENNVATVDSIYRKYDNSVVEPRLSGTGGMVNSPPGQISGPQVAASNSKNVTVRSITFGDGTESYAVSGAGRFMFGVGVNSDAGIIGEQSGMAAPGNSPGVLSVNGNYSQGSSAPVASNGQTSWGRKQSGTRVARTTDGGSEEFSTINGRHAGVGVFYDVEYNPTNVTLGAFDAPQSQNGNAVGHQVVVTKDGKLLAVRELSEGEEQELLQQGIGTEQYEPITENSFQNARQHPLSTFSVDVDTASYANVRRFLRDGRLPPADAVRCEELVNYFKYNYPSPGEETRHPFSVNMEVAQCPWNAKHRLLRVALAGRQIDREKRGPCNLIFLLDVSGSMRDENKLSLVRRGMKMLVDELGEDDRVAIVTYAGDAGLKLASTPGSDKPELHAAIDSLSAGGSTNGSAGIQLAYDLAAEHFVEEGANRVILATDGDLNVGITDDEALVELIQRRAAGGVFLTVLGFGTGNLKDAKLEKLADHGNGMYAYVDGLREARRVLVSQMSGSLVTIAKDVKLQLDFNCGEIAAYRLIGYENRLLSKEDYENDAKDAGEIGAGHQVTAFYELVPTTASIPAGRVQSRYQRVPEIPASELSELAASGDLLTLELRYKQPDAQESERTEEFRFQDVGKTFDEASSDFRFAGAVAAFGMLLRNSQYSGDMTLAGIEEIAASSIGEDSDGLRTEFLDLVRKASQLR